MIHVKQLMVGDWVYYTPTKKTKTPVRIGKIYVNEERSINEVNFYGNLGNDSILEICFDPIPLTEEILEKNFEKKTFYGIYDDYFDLDIREYSDSIYVVTFHNCEASFPDQSVTLSFVHELQHFLNHCGIEYEIKL